MSFDPTTLEQQGSFSAMQGLTPEENMERWRKNWQGLARTQDLVRHFNKMMGLPVNDEPTDLSYARRDFRYDQMHEEWNEFVAELFRAKPDPVKVAHELADLVYTCYGMAVEYGIDLDAVIREIHRANMTKTPHPEGGKAVKGEGFKPADVAGVLDG